ncbi:MAG: TonB family protein [Gemmatimonadaceae bacterium]
MTISGSGRAVRGCFVVLAAAGLLVASGGRNVARAQRSGVPVAADTQPKGTILGTVRDSAGVAVPGARVDAGANIAATTDSAGEFTLRDVPQGPVVLTVRRIGFAPAITYWDLGPDALSLDLRIHAFPTVLPTVYAQARPQPYDARLAGFNARRASGQGFYITRGEIDSLGTFRMTDVLTRVPGVREYTMRGALGTSVTLAGSRCQPLVMVDGFPAALGSFDLNMIDLSTVEGIEVYLHGSSVPASLSGPYGMEACGVIAIWSRPMRPNVRADQLPPEHAPNLDSLLKANVVYTAATVDQPAGYDRGTAVPIYPDSLYRVRVPGHVVVRFVVDTVGAVEMATIEVVSATAAPFSAAVRRALRAASFSPARIRGRPVRQLVEMPFDFRPSPTDSVPSSSFRVRRRGSGVPSI